MKHSKDFFEIYTNFTDLMDQYPDLTAAEYLGIITALLWYVHPSLERDTDEIFEDMRTILAKWENKLG